MRMPLAQLLDGAQGTRELSGSPGSVSLPSVTFWRDAGRGRAIAVTSPLHSGQGACRLPRI